MPQPIIIPAALASGGWTQPSRTNKGSSAGVSGVSVSGDGLKALGDALLRGMEKAKEKADLLRAATLRASGIGGLPPMGAGVIPQPGPPAPAAPATTPQVTPRMISPKLIGPSEPAPPPPVSNAPQAPAPPQAPQAPVSGAPADIGNLASNVSFKQDDLSAKKKLTEEFLSGGLAPLGIIDRSQFSGEVADPNIQRGIANMLINEMGDPRRDPTQAAIQTESLFNRVGARRQPLSQGLLPSNVPGGYYEQRNHAPPSPEIMNFVTNQLLPQVAGGSNVGGSKFGFLPTENASTMAFAGRNAARGDYGNNYAWYTGKPGVGELYAQKPYDAGRVAENIGINPYLNPSPTADPSKLYLQRQVAGDVPARLPMTPDVGGFQRYGQSPPVQNLRVRPGDPGQPTAAVPSQPTNQQPVAPQPAPPLAIQQLQQLGNYYDQQFAIARQQVERAVQSGNHVAINAAVEQAEKAREAAMAIRLKIATQQQYTQVPGPGGGVYNRSLTTGEQTPMYQLPQSIQEQQYRITHPGSGQEIAQQRALEAGAQERAKTQMEPIYDRNHNLIGQYNTVTKKIEDIPKTMQGLQDAQTKEAEAGRSQVTQASVITDAVSGLKRLARENAVNGWMPLFGTWSRGKAWSSDTVQGQARSYVDQLKSPVVLNTMMELKRLSQTGATGFGQLNRAELQVLIDSLGKLDPDNTSDQIMFETIDRIEKVYGRVFEDIRTKLTPDQIKQVGLDTMFPNIFGGNKQSGDGWRDLGNGVRIREKR